MGAAVRSSQQAGEVRRSSGMVQEPWRAQASLPQGGKLSSLNRLGLSPVLPVLPYSQVLPYQGAHQLLNPGCHSDPG